MKYNNVVMVGPFGAIHNSSHRAILLDDIIVVWYPVLQPLQNQYQLLQFMYRSVACSLFRRWRCKMGEQP